MLSIAVGATALSFPDGVLYEPVGFELPGRGGDEDLEDGGLRGNPPGVASGEYLGDALTVPAATARTPRVGAIVPRRPGVLVSHSAFRAP